MRTLRINIEIIDSDNGIIVGDSLYMSELEYRENIFSYYNLTTEFREKLGKIISWNRFGRKEK